MLSIVEINWVYTVFLFSMRLTPVLVMTPLLGVVHLSGKVKFILVLSLSALLVNLLDLLCVPPLSMWGVAWQMLRELMLGALLSFSIHVVFGALSFAGRLAETQMGLSLAGMINPVTKSSSSLIAIIFELLAVAYIYAINGHYLVLTCLVELLKYIPLGGQWGIFLVGESVRLFSIIFTLSLVLVAPLMMALFMLDITVALLSRSMPQFNAFIMSIPAKIGLGLMLLTSMLSGIGTFFDIWFRTFLNFLEGF